MSETIDSRVFNCLRKHGPRTSDQIMEMVGITRPQANNALSRLGIKRKNGVYTAPPDVMHEELISVVPPRSAPTFRPLKGYDATLRQGRELRDIGAMTTGVSPNPWRVPT